jgi:UDP-glucose 4-epimerase
VGGFEPISHRDLVHLLIATAGTGSYRFTEWPPDKKAIDIGDFYADWQLISDTLGWRPHTTLADGLRNTIAFYRDHFVEYVPAADGTVQR